MATVRDILDVIERMAPKRYALPTDKIGLQVGDPSAPVSHGLLSMDRSLSAIAHARAIGAQILVAHHPLLFHPLKEIDRSQYEGQTVYALIEAGIACVAAHTNWDAAIGGINDELAARLGLVGVRPFGIAADVPAVKLVFFCPDESAEAVIDAISATGAGRIGAYRRCAFSTQGTGTFIPGDDAHPKIGRAGKREEVSELRVEMVAYSEDADRAIQALRRSHPYEEPAYDVVPLRTSRELPLPRIGDLEKPVALDTFVSFVDERLSTRSLAWGDPKKLVRRVAVCGGSADEEWRNAQRAGADVLVTGEVRQHHALEASERGMSLVSAGHYATEHPGCEALRDRLAEEIPQVEWEIFVPEPGKAGRPFSAP